MQRHPRSVTHSSFLVADMIRQLGNALDMVCIILCIGTVYRKPIVSVAGLWLAIV